MPTTLQILHRTRRPPRFRNSTSAGTSAAGTTITISVPTGVLDGDLLIMAVALRGGTGVTNFACTGWTSLLSSNQGTNVQLNILYRVAASEPANYSPTWTGSFNAAGAIYAASRWDMVAPALTSQANTGSPAAMTAPSITPSNSPALLLLIGGSASGVTCTPATGMIERVDVKSTDASNNGALTIDEEVTRVASPTGTRAVTQSGGANSIAALVSVNSR